MAETEIVHKELDLIQNVISRMANNSFLLKGWLITIVVGVLALTKETLITDKIEYISIILFLPLITFWYLDAFFLQKERRFRELYKWVIENRKSTNDHLYSLNCNRQELKDKVDSILCIMFSKTLGPFYGITFLILLVITLNNFK